MRPHSQREAVASRWLSVEGMDRYGSGKIFQKLRKNGTLEQEFLSHNPELDRFIIEGMLEQPDVLLEEFSKAGVDKALVLRRAADCGISDSILRQMKRVAADLAGEKGQRRLIAQVYEPEVAFHASASSSQLEQETASAVAVAETTPDSPRSSRVFDTRLVMPCRIWW